MLMKHIVTAVVCLVAASVIGGSSAARAAIMDNFSDLNDTANPAWTHLDAFVGSTGQTWDASTGQYRLQAPNDGTLSLGFVGSYVGAEQFSDVRVSADITSFIDDPATQGAIFGVAARLNGNNDYTGLLGYGYVYEPQAAQGRGEVVLYRIGPNINVTDLGAQQVTLDPAKDYTFVLEVIGNELHGQVFEIGGGMVAERRFTDTTPLAIASGYSGLFAYSQNPLPPVDVTWDNFFTDVVPEPGTGLLAPLAAGALLLRRRSASRR
jgi:hypothetical protein